MVMITISMMKGWQIKRIPTFSGDVYNKEENSCRPGRLNRDVDVSYIYKCTLSRYFNFKSEYSLPC